MPLPLRSFQRQAEAQIYEAWGRYSGPSNIMLVMSTGAGKTVSFSKFLYDAQGYRGALVHRQELVSQISITLGRNQVRHTIIAPPNVVRMIVSMQIAELGTSYYDPNAKCFVAGVDTLNNRPDEPWMKQTGLIVPDEAHHVLKENKWGKACGKFPNAYGLFPTATPCRADRKGLGRKSHGLVDEMVLAPTMREIINMGFLTDYRIICAESDVRMSDSDITDTGDFNQTKLREAHHKSKKIVGDVVDTYLQYARGKLGITFAVDVEEATKIAAEFRRKGVPAEVVSAKTPDQLRAQIIRRFKAREVLQLVNVDLFGEGFDLPALEVVSFARHTASFALYCQQFGRALRLMIDPTTLKNWDSYSDAERRYFISISVKPRAIIIDHVGNVIRHKGPPDALWRAGQWSLESGEFASRGGASDAIPLRVCANKDVKGTGLPCAEPYERVLVKCPHCGHHPVPAERKGPEFVDGDMTELDEEAMARMRGDVAANLDAPLINPHWAPEIQGRLRRQHWEKQQAVVSLQNAVAWWAGLMNAQGISDAESYRRFYYKFGTDVGTMQTFNRAQAADLYTRVAAELAKFKIDASVNAGLHLLNH